MLKHPGVELQDIIREKGLTQKALAFLLGKKISEVNELLKGKRNITIQRDYLLHKALGTPIKYWINKQIDYEYSLLDTDELENKTNLENPPSEQSLNNKIPASDGEQKKFKEENNIKTDNLPSETKNIQNNDNIDNKNGQKNNDEDLKERANIFRSF